MLHGSHIHCVLCIMLYLGLQSMRYIYSVVDLYFMVEPMYPRYTLREILIILQECTDKTETCRSFDMFR